ncbi:MAG TPA: histidine kinase [Actinomycetales bacterium]
MRRLVGGPPALSGYDGLLAGVAVVLAASSGVGEAELALFAGLSALLVLVRRAPVAVTTLMAVLATLSIGLAAQMYVLVPTALLLAAAGVLCGRWGTVDVRLAAPVIPCLLVQANPLFFVAPLIVGLSVGALMQTRAAKTELLSQRLEQLEQQSQAQHAEQVGLEERGDLARELHDIVGHHVTAVVVLAEAAQARGADAHGDLARIADTGRAALAELDTLVTALRDPSSRPETTVLRGMDDLPELLDPLQHAGVSTALHVNVRDELSQGLQLAAYRIVQEALTNVMRHSGARSVRVTALQHEQSLRLTIDDDGDGFDPDAVTRGRGLVGIDERVHGHGGSWAVVPSPRGGARVAAELPVVRAVPRPGHVRTTVPSGGDTL